MTASIGVDIAMVVEEVCRLRTDLQSTKEDLHRTHTELADVQSEANSFSLAFTGVKQDLERKGRTCKTLEVEVCAKTVMSSTKATLLNCSVSSIPWLIPNA